MPSILDTALRATVVFQSFRAAVYVVGVHYADIVPSVCLVCSSMLR